MLVRICHITSVHPANDVRIFHKECVSLAKHYEVFLIAPNLDDDTLMGVHRVGVDLPQSRLRRQLRLGKVLQKAIEIDADVYHLHDPELLSMGPKLRRRGKKVIFDSHEDVPMQLLTKEYLPRWIRKPLSLVYAYYERQMMKQYDALVTVTPSILDRLSRINPHSVMVTNYPPYDELQSETRQTGGSKPYICFAGGVDERYMHEYVIESLQYTSARYLLAGRCFIPSYLGKLKALPQWERVDYIGVLPPEEVKDVYARADVGVVLLDYSPNVGYHKGTLGVLKLFEYMMAGIPVVATDFELWKEIVEGNDCGICIDPHDIHAIADAVNRLIDNPDMARQMGENGRRAVKEKYNWATQEQILFDLYDSLTTNHFSH